MSDFMVCVLRQDGELVYAAQSAGRTAHVFAVDGRFEVRYDGDWGEPCVFDDGDDAVAFADRVIA